MPRPLRIVILAWSVWWFGYMAAAHERGFVRDDAPASASCCAPQTGCCDAGLPRPCDDEPDPSRSCALCKLLARLELPLPVDLTPVTAGVVMLLPTPAPESAPAEEPVRAVRGRAPPFVV